MCEEKESSHWAGREHGSWMGPGPWMYGPWTYEPWMRHGMWGGFNPKVCPCCGKEIQPPTKAERIERLEAFKNRLEKRLSRINEKLEELKKEQ